MLMVYLKDIEFFYVFLNEWEMDIWNEFIFYKKGVVYFGVGFIIKLVNEDFIGVFKVIDFKIGKIVWCYNNFFLFWGGVLIIGGGLVWIGNFEGYFMVFDDKIGEMVYKF